MVDFLSMIFSVEGSQVLFVFFVPGFMIISCCRHWLNRLEGLSQLEIVFWSIPLSIAISGLFSAPFPNVPIPPPPFQVFVAVPLIMGAFLGSMVAFTAIFFIAYFDENRQYTRTRYYYYWLRHWIKTLGFRNWLKLVISLEKWPKKELCPVCKRKVPFIYPFKLSLAEKTRYDPHIGRETEIVAEDFMCGVCRRRKFAAQGSFRIKKPKTTKVPL